MQHAPLKFLFGKRFVFKEAFKLFKFIPPIIDTCEFTFSIYRFKKKYDIEYLIAMYMS